MVNNIVAMESIPHYTYISSKLGVPCAGKVTWGHAVNDLERLVWLIDSGIHFMEADVQSFGGEIVMAHNPNTSGPLLEDWIEKCNGHAGIKLDFKTPEALTNLKDLKELTSESFLWINADILSGPKGDVSCFLNDTVFIHVCQKVFPRALLSLGWTTCPRGMSYTPSPYTSDMVTDMLDWIDFNGFKNRQISFAMRAMDVSVSRKDDIMTLLSASVNYSITLWTGPESLTDEMLDQLQQDFPISRLFVDRT